MKPCSRNTLPSGSFLQSIGVGSKKTVTSIRGSVKKLGQQFSNATIVIYEKSNMLPIAIKKPDQDGNFEFNGLGSDVRGFLIAFDESKQYNAVIQDNVVPK